MAMDGGKGVMMSERPSGGGGGGGGDAGVSIGNYKGVMLCNRPFAGATAGAHGNASSSGEARPFVTGIDKERVHPRGWDPSKRERKNTVPERNYKNTALSKHKQWLRKLQQQRAAALEEAEREEGKKAAKHQAFLETQQRMRDVVRGLATADVVDTHAIVHDATISGTTGAVDPNAQERALQASILSAAQQKKVSRGQKPAWAYTAEAKEKAEEDEADELLRFAESLDFDQYLDDLEVRSAMEQAKAQLEALEKERVADQLEAAAQARAEARAAAHANGERVVPLTADSLRQFDAENGDDNKENRVDAQTVMSNVSAAESIRSVHSTKSLQAVINREKTKLGGGQGLPAISEGGQGFAGAAMPRIITHDETGGTRITNKDLVSQLPYMNRNPAV